MSGVEITVLIVVVTTVVLLAGWFQWRLSGLRKQLAAAERAVADLAAELNAAPIDLSRTLGGGKRQVIALEILNPSEVAAEKSRLAKNLGGLAPNLLRAEVNRQAAEQLVGQLAEYGIEAEVRIHDAA